MSKQKHFYSHLVSLNSIEIELNKLGLPEHERIELISLAENTIHYTIIDIALSNLKDEHKKKFLEHAARIENHELAWNLLKENVEGIEEKIIKSIDLLKTELLIDIKNLKKAV